MKVASRRAQLAAQEDVRRATLPSAQAHVELARPRANAVDHTTGENILQAQTADPFQVDGNGAMVATFRPTLAMAAATSLVASQPVMLVPRNGIDLPPLRVGLRTVVDAAVRRTVLLAMVTARANSNRSRSNLARPQSPKPTNQNQGGETSEEE
jgi:hypothetical protein